MNDNTSTVKKGVNTVVNTAKAGGQVVTTGATAISIFTQIALYGSIVIVVLFFPLDYLDKFFQVIIDLLVMLLNIIILGLVEIINVLILLIMAPFQWIINTIYGALNDVWNDLFGSSFGYPPDLVNMIGHINYSAISTPQLDFFDDGTSIWSIIWDNIGYDYPFPV